MEGYVPLSLRRRRDSDGKIIVGKGGSKPPMPPPTHDDRAYATVPSLLGRSDRLHPLEPIHGGKSSAGAKRDEVPNPLTVFPTSGGVDRVSQVFWSEPKKQVRQFWLSPLVAHNPAALDAVMKSEGGASGPQDSAEREAARWFRGHEAKKLLAPEAMRTNARTGDQGSAAEPSASSITKFADRHKGRPKRKSLADPVGQEFVMVPKQQLAELTKIESLLQEERKALGQQCTWLMTDTQCSTRHPQPYVVAAVNHICDKEIETAAAAVAQLRAWRWKSLEQCIKEWEASRATLGYLNLTNYTPKEHVELAPLCQRPAVHKGALLRFFKGRWIAWQQEELEAEERERQTMVREEAAQRQCLRAQEAAERKADYGIYASLTTHFGPLPADLFARQHRPGAFYQSHVLQAATMIERFWQHAFPFRVARKRNAARLMQALYRAFRMRQRILPVHRFRDALREKKARKHLLAWWSVAGKRVSARRFLLRLYHKHEKWAIKGWHVAAVKQRDERARKLQLLQRQFAARHMLLVFRGWSKFTNQMLRVKAFQLRQLEKLLEKVYDLWAENVADIAFQRAMMAASVKAQKVFRGYMGRKLFRETNEAKQFGALMFQKVCRGHRGRRRADELFRQPLLHRLRITFWRQQKERELKDLRDRVKAEEARLAKETLLLGLAEADALARERAQSALQKAGSLLGGKKRREQLLAETRYRARHEFRRLHAPLLAHANPSDASTFVCDEHYIKHFAESKDTPDLLAEFHLLLRRNDGWPLLQRFLEHRAGVTAVRDFLFWQRLQEIKTLQANTKSFQVMAEDICTRFIAVEKENRVAISDEQARTIVSSITAVKATTRREVESNAASKDAGDAGDGGSYVAPQLFYDAEWTVLQYLFRKWYHLFLESEEGDSYRQVLANEARGRENLEIAFFRRRKALMLQDARAVRAKLRLQKVWKKQALALVFLRAKAKSGWWFYNRRCRAQAFLYHKGRQARASAWLVWKAGIAKWNINRQARACKRLREIALHAKKHCARQEGALKFLAGVVTHYRRRMDQMAALQCRAVLGEVVMAVSFGAVLYHRQFTAVTWLRQRSARALVHCQRQDSAREFLVTWGCRVLGHSTPAEVRASKVLQRVFRACLAKMEYRVLINAVIDKVYDHNAQRYYYVNKKTGEVQWRQPVGMGKEEMLTPRSFRAKESQKHKDRAEFALERRKAQRMARGGFSIDEAALLLQRMGRGKIARSRFGVRINEAWEVFQDDRTGEDYYHDRIRNTTTYDKPILLHDRELLSPRSLEEQKKEDAAALKQYTTQRKLRWQAEAAWEAQQQRQRRCMRSGGLTEKLAATIIQATWRMRASRKEMRDLARQVYKLEFDESSGKYYYANVKTGESTWSKPMVMGSEDIEFDYGSNTLKGRHADPGGVGAVDVDYSQGGDWSEQQLGWQQSWQGQQQSWQGQHHGWSQDQQQQQQGW